MNSIPVFIRNKPCYFLWSPIFNPEYFAFMKKYFENKPLNPKDRAFFPMEIMKNFLVGNIVIIIPAQMDESSMRKVLLSSYEEQSTQLALDLKNGEMEFCTGFNPFLKKQLSTGKLPDKEFWVTGSETFDLESPFSIVAVTPLDKPDREMKLRHSLITVFISLSFFVCVCILFSSVFIEIGAARSIPGQLWSSFTLSSLLLLAILFFFVQELVEERHKLALQQNRLKLLEEMESIENRFMLHRPGLRSKMEEISFSDQLLFHSREGQKRADRNSPQPKEFVDLFQNAFNKLYFPPNDMSLRRFTVSGVNGFFHAATRIGRNEQIEFFPRVVGAIFEQTLRELNPGLPNRGEGSLPSGKGVAREAIYAEVALQHLGSVFGGEAQLVHQQLSHSSSEKSRVCPVLDICVKVF